MKNVFIMLFLSIFLQLNCVVDGNASAVGTFTPTCPYRNAIDTPLDARCGLGRAGSVDAAPAPSVINPLDAREWDQSDFLSVISRYFPSEYEEIKKRYNEFQHSTGKHLSVAQIIIRTKFDGSLKANDNADIRGSYVIPYIFVSGLSGWDYNKSSTFKYYRGIQDFGCSCSSPQAFAHSEVALGCCLLFDKCHSWGNICNMFRQRYPSADLANAQVIIQVKNSHNEGSCENCIRFLSGISYTDASGRKFQSPKKEGAKPFNIGTKLMEDSDCGKIMVGSTASGEKGMHPAYFAYVM